MDKYFVFLEAAKILKNLGFNELCFATYNSSGRLIFEDGKRIKNSSFFWVLTAPIYAQVFDWFEEVHGLKSWIVPSFLQGKVLHSFKINGMDYTEEGYTTKEEAQLECIKELIYIVKNRKE